MKITSIKPTSLFSLIIIAVFYLFMLFGISDAFNEKNKHLILWYKNKAKNDNSQNWACHNYAHNLMMSAEKDAIFMTEGGDNQVFSLLYFAYVEHKRPDIDFYDQKGNVFPRLYGDLMKAYGYNLDIMRALRDYQLFSVGRPIYLTWNRDKSAEDSKSYMLKDLHPDRFQDLFERKKQQIQRERRGYLKKYHLSTLAQIEREIDTMVPKKTFNMKFRNGQDISKVDLQELGPWYFKQYGILYKVTPMRYQVIDAFETKESLSKETLLQTLRPKPSPEELDGYLNQLQQEELIQIDHKNIITLASTHPYPFETLTPIDYWQYYKFDYKNQPNAIHWDYLTREIFHSYASLQSEAYLHQKQISRQLPHEKLSANLKPQNLEVQIEASYKDATIYAHDTPPTYYTYARYAMGKGKTQDALNAYSNCARISYELFDPHLNIARIHLNTSQSTSAEQEKQFLNKAKQALDEAKKRYFFAARKAGSSVRQAGSTPQYQTILSQIQQVEAYLSFSRTELQSIENKVKTEKNPNPKDLKILYKAYAKRRDFYKANRSLDKLAQIEPTHMRYPLQAYNFAKLSNPHDAEKRLTSLIKNHATYSQNTIPLHSLQIKGISLHYNQAKRALKNRNFHSAYQSYQKAIEYINAFYKITLPLQNQSTIKNRIIEVQRVENDIQKQIKSLSPVLNQASP